MNKSSQSYMRSIKRQQGWTIWTLMFTMGVILFFAYVGMQLVPVYNANSTVTNAMNQTVDELDLYKTTRGRVVTQMRQQLYLDGNDELLDFKTDLTITRTKTKFTLSTNYNRDIPLFFNISMLVKFDNVVERELGR